MKTTLNFEVSSEPKQNGSYNMTEQYGKELHDIDSEAWDEILKAIDAGASKDGDSFLFPWYESGLDVYLSDNLDLY